MQCSVVLGDTTRVNMVLCRAWAAGCKAAARQEQLATSLNNPEVVAALSAQIPAHLAAHHSDGALLTSVSESDSRGSDAGNDGTAGGPGDELTDASAGANGRAWIDDVSRDAHMLYMRLLSRCLLLRVPPLLHLCLLQLLLLR
jgi:hypothetical protein